MAQTTPSTEPMAAELAALLGEFARTCKAAARAVSLYPGTHPAIASSLSRLVLASTRLTNNARIVCGIRPDIITIGGRAPVRPDPAIGELASLLHDRLIGELTIEGAADAEDWRALLLLLARSPEDLMAGGGITQAWNLAGRSHFVIREIDYAEVLRERNRGDRAQWDRIVETCLQGDRGVLDNAALDALIHSVADAETFGDLLEHLQRFHALSDLNAQARTAAVLQLMRAALEAVRKTNPDDAGRVMQTMADACARLSPEMMLGLVDARQTADPVNAQFARAVVECISEECAASFVARAVTSEGRVSDELTRAFDALAPEQATKERIIEMAREEAGRSDAAQDPGFDDLWTQAGSTLKSGVKKMFVPDEYGRELTEAGTQALEVERVSDDPPERVQGWVDTVSESALHGLDLLLLRDLLRIELDPSAWEQIALIVVGELERRVLQSDISSAHALAESLAAEMASKSRPPLRQVAARVLDRLRTGPLVRHVVLHLRKDDARVEELSRLCQTIGASLARPLAELLAVEENERASLRLRELLLSFGAAGRQSVEQLKHSANPAVRRMAIDLLRVFGGQEALAELASMLDDTDPQVQRESIRAIVQIGTNSAYAVLQRALVATSGSRETVLQELLALREDKATPLFCYVLRQTEPTGKLFRVHADMIDAVGNLKIHSESVRALKHVLYRRGPWWTPLRTGALRRRAALALRRLGTPEARSVLEEASAGKLRGPRKAARAQLDRMTASGAART